MKILVICHHLRSKRKYWQLGIQRKFLHPGLDSKICISVAFHQVVSYLVNVSAIRVKFSNFYLLIGWEIKSYLANSENFWRFGLYEGDKAKKGQKTKFWQMNQNSLIHGEN